MKDKMALVVVVLLIIIIFSGVIYGSYWVMKTVSYSIFYEDMVRATVVEMVEPGALKKR